MARLPRMYDEEGIYFVTARTFQARMLLTPKPMVSEAMAGVLAKAVSLTGVRLYGFVAASNHVHLLVGARGAALSRFMQYLLGNVAKKVGRLAGWRGSFWQRRFSAEPVLDDEALVGRLKYILAHGVKEGLVETPEEWPGLSCLPLLRSEAPVKTKFFHWARRWQKGALREGGGDVWNDAWAEEVALQVHPLPCWEGLSRERRLRAVDDIVEGIVAEGREAHARVRGAGEVIAEEPQREPRYAKKSPRPLCHASTRERWKAFRQTLMDWVTAFRRASALYRAGDVAAEFPPWSFRPTLLYEVYGT